MFTSQSNYLGISLLFLLKFWELSQLLALVDIPDNRFLLVCFPFDEQKRTKKKEKGIRQQASNQHHSYQGYNKYHGDNTEHKSSKGFFAQERVNEERGERET